MRPALLLLLAAVALPAAAEEVLDPAATCEGCPCPKVGAACGLKPLVALEALCEPPRPDETAEWLAMEARRTFVADAATYERVVRDLTAIREAFPALAGVRVYRPHAPGLVMVVKDPSPFTAGKVRAFDCLLRTYRARATVLPELGAITVQLPARADVARLVPTVRRLPGVEQVELDGTMTVDPPSDVCLSLGKDGRATYIFHPGGSGYTGVTVSRDGTVAELGTWDGSTPRGGPPWFRAARACRVNLQAK